MKGTGDNKWSVVFNGIEVYRDLEIDDAISLWKSLYDEHKSADGLILSGPHTCEADKWKVYLHVSPSRKVYVGITCQTIRQRWRNGKGYRGPFRKAVDKYGWQNIKHYVLCDGISAECAGDLEIRLIDALGANKKKTGYNISAGGLGTAGVHPSEETREKLRLIHNRPVYQFDKDMNFINRYCSISEASRKTGIAVNLIGMCCRLYNGCRTGGGYVWVYESDCETLDKDWYSNYLNHEKLPKAVWQFTLDLEFVAEYPSIGQAAKAVGISSTDITNAINCRRSNTCKGYMWTLKGEYPKKKFIPSHYRGVCQYTLDGKFVREYKTQAEAGRSMGVTIQAIAYACKSKYHQSCGYIWRKKDEVMDGDESTTVRNQNLDIS